MAEKALSRRIALKHLASMGALGALGAVRSLPVMGAIESVADTAPDVTGKVIYRRDAAYELWRQSMVWHDSKPERYPEIIIQAHSEQDVVAAVIYAAENGHKVAVRSGGHNSTGSALRDGGVLVDVSAMNTMEIDTSTNQAWIQPGVRSLQLMQEARAQGLSFPVPHCPSVGLSGFVMGGGIGWNYQRSGGMSTFSIMGAEIVTADGRIVFASATENSDLYWAVRGAGPGFFGVVTRLRLQLYPLPTDIMSSTYIFPLDKLEVVTNILDDLIKDEKVTEKVELLAVLMHHPELRSEGVLEGPKICVVTAFAFEDSPVKALDALKPITKSDLASHSQATMENQPFTYEGLYDEYFSLSDSAGRVGRYAVDNVLTQEGSKTLLALAEHLQKAPSTDCHILATWGHNLKERDDACFSGLGDSYVGCYAVWDGKENDTENFAWLDQALPLMDPFAEGHYVNEVEGRGHPDRYRQCFTEDKWNRLKNVRGKHDPNGVFHSFLGHS